MINRSKLVCSKKLVDTIFQLLDTIQANVTFLSTGRIRLIFGDQMDLISFTFSQKRYQLLELQMVDKCFGKCQLLNTIYSKENGVHVQQLGQGLSQVRCTCMAVRLGVHVWQLGQVYMYVSKVQLGQVRLGQVRLGQVRIGKDRIGQDRIGQDRIGQVRLGQELGQVGQFRS